MSDEDMLIITADHGCDPSTPSTDHSRENVPLLIYKKGEKSENLGTIDGFCYVSEIISDYFGIEYKVKEVDAAPMA